MWHRDEFLANERVAEKTRRIVDAARVRSLLGTEDPPPAQPGFGDGAARRALARVMAAGAGAAMAAAMRLDPGVKARV